MGGRGGGVLMRLRNLPDCDNRLTFVTLLAGRRMIGLWGFSVFVMYHRATTTTSSSSSSSFYCTHQNPSSTVFYQQWMLTHPRGQLFSPSLSSLHLISPPSYTDPLAPPYPSLYRRKASSIFLQPPSLSQTSSSLASWSS
jgi:hypothetical protein